MYILDSEKYLIARGSIHLVGLCSYYIVPLNIILEGTPTY